MSATVAAADVIGEAWRGLRQGGAAAVLACAGAAFAQAPGPAAVASSADAGDVRDVRSFLLRIHEAASQRNYQGTFIVSGGGTMSSSRIAHYTEGPDQLERIDSLDGERRQMLRHNDTVQIVRPASGTVQIEQRDVIKGFPALLQAGDDRIGEHYQVFRQGGGRVAGRDADVVLVQPRDHWRFGYRLWADQASGLLLRADVLGEGEAILETAAFSEVSVGVPPQASAVLAAMRKFDGAHVVRPMLRATQLDDEGWSVRDTLPGFRLVSCFRRQLGTGEPRGDDVLQAIFSDGLTHVSLFVEDYDPSRHPRALVTSVGATRTLMRRHGDAWVTAVGDVPLPTLRRFVAALERRR